MKILIAKEKNDERTLIKGFYGFKLYRKVAKIEKRKKFKALKLFARNTKRHGF
jgi:hypothetical protein